MSKQYGLIVPNKLKKPAIFEESDSDEAVPTGIRKVKKKQDEITKNRALEEDPTVFQYDEIYDDMDKKRNESKLRRKDIDRAPKYINRLLAAADRRKRENERRIERQVQKEREMEGSEFKDKESFVTNSYKKKLEEMKELDEEERREEYLESIGDVKKQGNLDGFYRHLYEQKVNYEEKKEPDKTTKDDNKQHIQSNLDADSDFSIDSSDSEQEPEKPVEIKEEKEEVKVEEPEVVVPEKKPKIDIWKKRTVGEAFDSALQRYYERKAVREL